VIGIERLFAKTIRVATLFGRKCLNLVRERCASAAICAKGWDACRPQDLSQVGCGGSGRKSFLHSGHYVALLPLFFLSPLLSSSLSSLRLPLISHQPNESEWTCLVFAPTFRRVHGRPQARFSLLSPMPSRNSDDWSIVWPLSPRSESRNADI